MSTTAEILDGIDALSDQLSSLAANTSAAVSSISTRIDALRLEVEAIPDPNPETVTRDEFAMFTETLKMHLAEVQSNITELFERVADIEDGEPQDPPDDPPPPPGGDRKIVLADSGSADHLDAAVKEAGEDISIVLIPPGPANVDHTVIAPDTCSFGAQGSMPKLQKTFRGEEFSQPLFAVFHTGRPTIHEFRQIGQWAQSPTLREISLCYFGAVNFRVHHNEFHNFGRSGYETDGDGKRFGAVAGQPIGVSWGNLYKDGLNSGGYLGYGVSVNGYSKQSALVLPGSTRMVVSEDETFDGRRHSTVGNNYAIYAARHNRVLNQLKNAHAFDNHGLAHWPAGGRWVEIYNNLIESNAPGVRNSNYGASIRGGGAVLFGNRWNNTIANGHIAVVFESSGNQSDSDRQIWTSGSRDMPQAGDAAWTKQVHAWDNLDHNGNLVAPIPKNSRIVLGRDVLTAMPADYTPLAYPHPWRKGYELAA